MLRITIVKYIQMHRTKQSSCSVNNVLTSLHENEQMKMKILSQEKEYVLI